MFCTSCGAPNTEGASACAQCGAALTTSSAPQQQPYAPPQPYAPSQQPYAPPQQPYAPPPQPYAPQQPYAPPQQPYAPPQQPYAPPQPYATPQPYTPQQQEYAPPQPYAPPPQAYAQQQGYDPQYGAPQYGAPPQKKKKGLIIGLAAGGLAIVAFLIVLFTVILPGTTDEGQIKSIIKAFEKATNEASIEPVRKYLPPDMGQSDFEDMEESLQSMRSYFDIGLNVQYSVSISYGEIVFNEDKTKARVEATMTVTITGKGSMPTDSTLYFQKINGKWYIDD